MKSKKQVFAIIRIDFDCSDIKDKITVKSIVEDIEFAKSEIERLNRINKNKNCEYFLQTTRYIK